MQHIIGQEPLEDDELDFDEDEIEKQVRADIASGRITRTSSSWVCQAMPDGSIACGPRHPRPISELSEDELLLLRQETAGEEDQSVPGWDQGA